MGILHIGTHMLSIERGGLLSINDIWILFSKSFIYNIYFSFNSSWYLRLLLFQIKSQPVDVYKSVTYLKKHEYCFVVFQTWSINFPSCVCFVYPIFHWGDIAKKIVKSARGLDTKGGSNLLHTMIFVTFVM